MQTVRRYDESPRLCYKFTGKERDAESGLDDFEARYYSSAFGRFMQVDDFKGGPLDLVVDRGPRKEMLAKERQRVETNPGPKNREPWAGKKKVPKK